MCYAKAEGVSQNYKAARRLFALGSAQGHTQSTKALRHVDETIRNYPHQTSTKPTVRKKPKPNASCPCGSGIKHKKCCGSNH